MFNSCYRDGIELEGIFRQINIVTEGVREGGERGGGDLEIIGPGKLCLLVV